MNVRVYFDLLDKCEGIKEFKEYEVILGIFSKSGFDKRLMEISRNNNKLILINQENILI